MLRGLKYSWKQPIAFVVSHSNVSNVDLQKLILSVIDKVHSVGLDIKATACDQGSANRTALASLGVTVEKPFILRQLRTIYCMYDVPHLVKSVRNNLLNKDFVIGSDTISWGALRELRTVESNSVSRAAPKLTDRHIYPNNFERMTVSLATQVFSNTVSAALNTGKFTGDLKNPACSATANFCNTMNDLFDCLNSRSCMDPNPLQRAMSADQPQVDKFLEACVQWIEKWTVKDCRTPPPCINGFIMTIKSVRLLAADMIASGSPYLITSRLNQDPLENLFGTLRGRSGCNQNPSAMTMRRNLQYFMVADLEKSSLSTNCEEDDSTALLSVFDRGVRKELDDELVNRKGVASDQIDENSPSHVQSCQQSEEAVTNNSVSAESDEKINKSVLVALRGKDYLIAEIVNKINQFENTVN